MHGILCHRLDNVSSKHSANFCEKQNVKTWKCFFFNLRAEIAVINVSLCRYDFPWSFTKYIPFYGGAEYHDYHHYVGGQSQSNFASVFTYCDYIYGTDKVNCIVT